MTQIWREVEKTKDILFVIELMHQQKMDVMFNGTAGCRNSAGRSEQVADHAHVHLVSVWKLSFILAGACVGPSSSPSASYARL